LSVSTIFAMDCN